MTKIIKEPLILKDTQEDSVTVFLLTRDSKGLVKYSNITDLISQLGSDFIPQSEKGVNVATLIGGKLDPTQVPDLAITSVQTVAENTLTAFVSNNAAYTYEEGDVLIINDVSGNLTHYMFDGGDKFNEQSYSLINATEIEISQVNGLQLELDGKLTPTGDGSQLTGVAKPNIDNDFSTSQTFNEDVDFKESVKIRGDLDIFNGSTGAEIKLSASNTSWWKIERDPTTGNFTVEDDGVGKVLDISQITGNAAFSNLVSSSVTNAQIDAASVKVLPTKEWVQANSGGLPANFYEEGTFTPSLIDLGGVATYTVLTTFASYIRIGNNVNFNIVLANIDTVGAPTGTLQLIGLPFVMTNSPTSIFNTRLFGTSVDLGTIQGIYNDTTKLIFTNSVSSSSGGSIYGSVNLTNGNIFISGTYKTNVYTP